ncbi:hypothetical protein CDV31_011764 [Fusarium ambrosium]|uniref:Uncharacterized protein n=1 Tax=Fusarium ambrosium TaxID=131363 RepID=A0A428TER3_9HYPO|nr:hypothetical protein CDV31_011764 [Fusarium ambrosium]
MIVIIMNLWKPNAPTLYTYPHSTRLSGTESHLRLMANLKHSIPTPENGRGHSVATNRAANNNTQMYL